MKSKFEDFVQQEDGSLEGLELFQQHQERLRDRLFPNHTNKPGISII